MKLKIMTDGFDLVIMIPSLRLTKVINCEDVEVPSFTNPSLQGKPILTEILKLLLGEKFQVYSDTNGPGGLPGYYLLDDACTEFIEEYPRRVSSTISLPREVVRRYRIFSA